eukprot:EG_transcript_30871
MTGAKSSEAFNLGPILFLPCGPVGSPSLHALSGPQLPPCSFWSPGRALVGSATFVASAWSFIMCTPKCSFGNGMLLGWEKRVHSMQWFTVEFVAVKSRSLFTARKFTTRMTGAKSSEVFNLGSSPHALSGP